MTEGAKHVAGERATHVFLKKARAITMPPAPKTAPCHAHVDYDVADRGVARSRLRRELSTAKRAGELLYVLFVGEMRDQAVGLNLKPQFEIHFLEDALPRFLPLLRATGLTALVHPLTDDDLADHTSLALGFENRCRSMRRCSIPRGKNQDKGRRPFRKAPNVRDKRAAEST